MLTSLLRLGNTGRSSSVGVLARGEPKGRVVDSVELEEEEQEEDGAGEDIEDAVPDHLGGR